VNASLGSAKLGYIRTSGDSQEILSTFRVSVGLGNVEGLEVESVLADIVVSGVDGEFALSVSFGRI